MSDTRLSDVEVGMAAAIDVARGGLELMRDFVSTRSTGGTWRWARATLASIEAQTSG